MAEEMAAHLEMQAEANRAQGMEAAEARYAALRQFGGVAQVQERCREQRGWVWLEILVRDVWYALRSLRRSPGFVAVAVLSLALGIGANTAVFSLVNELLLRPLPVLRPHELRVLQWSGVGARIERSSGRIMLVGDNGSVVGPAWEHSASGRRTLGGVFTRSQFQSLRDASAGEAAVFGFAPVGGLVARAAREAFAADGMLVSDNFFTALAPEAMPGRPFWIDSGSGENAVVVLSHACWQRHFDGNAAVVGRAVTLNGRSFTVVGVLPREFRGVEREDGAGFYLPLSARPVLLPALAGASADNDWWLQVMARVRSGADEQRVQAVLGQAFAGIAMAQMTDPRVVLRAGATGPDADASPSRRPLLVLLGAAGAVLLVACGNLGGLLLVRADGRRHELAVRVALGCGRWRLLRQLWLESVLLASAGGAAGLLLAYVGTPALASIVPGVADQIGSVRTFDPTVLSFAAGVSLVTALVAGGLPAWLATRVGPAAGLKSVAAGSRAPRRLGRLYVVPQIAVSMILVVGAGLFARTLRNLQRVDPGFVTDHLVLVEVNLQGFGNASADSEQGCTRVEEALAVLPGVRGVALTEYRLLSGSSGSATFELEGRENSPEEREAWPRARTLTVDEGFFAVVGIPVHEGRALAATDRAETAKVVVVNAALAQRYFPGGIAVGRTLRFGADRWRIVGVCGDACYESLRDPGPPTVYFSRRQRPLDWSACFALRTEVPLGALGPMVRAAVANAEPTAPVMAITTQDAERVGGFSRENSLAILFGLLAALAVLLACLGLHGLMAHGVARRTGEIGVRVALGASPAEVVGPILREVLGLASMGVGIGVGCGWMLTPLVGAHLFGVSAHDPGVLALGAALFVLVAAIATWLPARRAARIDPAETLRAE